MKIFEKTREKIGYWLLKSQVSHQKRKFRYHNFKTAKSIFILFDARNSEILETIKNFSEFILQKQIKLTSIGFIDKMPEKEHIAYTKSIVLFSAEKSTFWGIPKNSEYEEFSKSKPDMLINLCLKKKLPIDYIFGNSQAEFKISSSNNLDFADFTIDVSKNPAVEYLIEQITKYLEMIEVDRSLQ